LEPDLLLAIQMSGPHRQHAFHPFAAQLLHRKPAGLENCGEFRAELFACDMNGQN
jgi:hypothetical protein